jgi:hypothetical protein
VKIAALIACALIAPLLAAAELEPSSTTDDHGKFAEVSEILRLSDQGAALIAGLQAEVDVTRAGNADVSSACDRLDAELKNVDFATMMAPIYAAHWTAADIQEALAWYRSPEFKERRDVEAKVIADVMLELGGWLEAMRNREKDPRIAMPIPMNTVATDLVRFTEDVGRIAKLSGAEKQVRYQLRKMAEAQEAEANDLTKEQWDDIHRQIDELDLVPMFARAVHTDGKPFAIHAQLKWLTSEAAARMQAGAEAAAGEVADKLKSWFDAAVARELKKLLQNGGNSK